MFEGLDDEDLEELASSLREHRLMPGDMVFHEGDRGDSMFIVAGGEVNIHLPGDATTRVSLANLEAGTYFGEIALFDDKPRSASVQAIRDTLLLELGRTDLVTFLDGRPGVMIGILQTLSERLRETNTMLSERAARNAREDYERAQDWPDRLADRVAELNGSWTFILSLAGLMLLWAAANLPRMLFGEPPDPYPYIFFNVLLAILVAVQWPLIVMSQNRQANKERKEAEIDFMVNLKNETNCEDLLSELRTFRMEWIGREKELAALLSRRRLSMLPPPPAPANEPPPPPPTD